MCADKKDPNRINRSFVVDFLFKVKETSIQINFSTRKFMVINRSRDH